MNKPNNYETTEAFTGDGKYLTTGGKVCVIVNAYETTARSSGKPMLAIEFDIAEGDEKEYFADLQERFGGDWRGVYRQNTLDANGECSPFFKGMISAIEDSNAGFKFNFDERQLLRKKFGGVFGEEEYVAKDGTVKTIVKLMQIRSVDAIRKGEFKVPPKKTVSAPVQPASVGFSEVSSEQIPF